MIWCSNVTGAITTALSPYQKKRWKTLHGWKTLLWPAVSHWILCLCFFLIQPDSSHFACGGFFGGAITGEPWTIEECSKHINYKELLAALLTLQSFCRNMSHVHIHLVLDNTPAVAYISRFGGKYSDLNDLAQSIWEFVNKRHINLACSHLPGARNINADYASRACTGCRRFLYTMPCFLFVFHFSTFQPYRQNFAEDSTRNGGSNHGSPMWPKQVWFTRLLELCVDHPRLLQTSPLHFSHKPTLSHPMGPRL